MTDTRAEAFLDTENLFHGLRPERTPASDSAFASLKALLPREAVERPGSAGILFRTLRDLLDWQAARHGTTPTATHSYGKTVDSAVRLLHEEAKEIGDGFEESTRGATRDSYRGQRSLVDFRARIDLGFEEAVTLDHTDVPEGKDEGELRLLADLKTARLSGEFPDSCLLGSGDAKVIGHVDRLPQEVRARILIAVPPSSAEVRKKIGAAYSHLRPRDVALVTELRVLAAKARQRPATRTPKRPPPVHSARPLPPHETIVVEALLAVDWPALGEARVGAVEWIVAARSLLIVDAVDRSFADETFLARFDAPARRATVTALRDGSINPTNIRFLVTCAVLYDTMRRDETAPSLVRRSIGTSRAHGFLRDALDGVRPLIPLVAGQAP